jgi:LysM repeat protein
MAELISTAQNNITTTQFETWNPNMLGFCDQLVADQYVCISAPGGSYISPPASNSTSNDSGQQRGGGDGSGTSTGSGGVAGGGRNATTISVGGPAPSPTQSGITPSCTEYAQAQSGDGCYSLTSLWQISEQNFYAWNTILGPNGANCSTELFAGYWYCIDVQGATTTSSAPSTTSTTPASTPSPVQPGIDPQCTKYAEAKSGDYCSEFASNNDITTAELYQWNPVLGQNGANCSLAFQANTYYCVGAPSSTTPTTTAPSTTSTAPSTPSPVQTGIDPQCTKYAEAQSGDYCSKFASDNSISTTELYEWNPILGSDGSQCNTEFQANTYYCVGAPTSTATTTTTTTTPTPTTTASPAPSPTQSGIVSNCDKYAEAKSGDYCSQFASENNITTAELYEWNTILGSDGSQCNTEFQANTYYCVGVSS